jgi:hypothetical protein
MEGNGAIAVDGQGIPITAQITVMELANGAVTMKVEGVKNLVQHVGLLQVALEMALSKMRAPAESPQVIPVTRLPNGMRALN